ncbi:AEC family transporter [Pseudoalteromonas xiamenensis]|uniref:AEC family transporter n=1 Tax=Pseudoalteromonas xiamenensis TaxID=882626 RepID=A0A975DJ17_9GAMM|nr:AEC family transporter [Pseudoalteromonas xiamenensis]QTH72678.1 AEC family transporter [Pseudoalteromonas xiamenensis]
MSAFSTIFPLAFIVLFGFISSKRLWVNTAQLDGIRHFIFNLILPIFLFTNMLKADLHAQLNLASMLSFYVPVVLTFVIVYAIGSMVLAYKKVDMAVFALGCTYSNTVLVALPVILLQFGLEAGAMVFVIITFHSALLFAMTFLLARNPEASKRQIMSSLVKNPIVASITLGILANLLLPPFPSVLLDAMTLAGQPALAGALFVLGANLSYYQIGSMWKEAALISLIKLILLPASVFALAKYGFALTSQQIAVVTLMSAAPLGVNAYLVSRQLNTMQPQLAGGVVLSTMLSALTLSGWISILTP